MKTCIKMFFVLVLGMAISPVFAQTASIGATVDVVSDLKSDAAEDYFFYSSDEEEQTVFIDFENIKISLNEIVLRNENGKELLREDVSHLPVNSIYEINLKDYKEEVYVIELKSYSKTIRRALVP